MRAGQLLHIQVLDHVILGQQTTDRPRDFVSLRELGFEFPVNALLDAELPPPALPENITWQEPYRARERS